MSNHEFINASKEGILENKCIKESLIQLQINLNMTAFIFTTQNGHTEIVRELLSQKSINVILKTFFSVHLNTSQKILI